MARSPVATRPPSRRPFIDRYDGVSGTPEPGWYGVSGGADGATSGAASPHIGWAAERSQLLDDERDAILAATAPEDEEPPVPQWALDAAAEHDRTDLMSAAWSDFSPFSRAALAGMRALELCDPVGLAEAGHARAVLDGIVAAHRMVAHVQAIQQRWIAAFARPGVAVPLRDVVESVGNSFAEKFGAELPVTDDGSVDIPAALAHPIWRPAIVDAASRCAAAEISCATHLAPITARIRVERAGMMVDTLPTTLAAQQAGHLDGYRAGIIADGVAELPAELRQQVERDVMAVAADCTASELRRHVTHAVMTADPAGAAERAAGAAMSRHTSVTAIDNDMALFRAVLSAPNALTVHGVLDSVATSLQAAGLADGRGGAQLRADVFADLFHTLATTGHAHIAVPHASDSADAARPVASSSRPATTAQPATDAAQPATTARPATGIAPCCDGASRSDDGLAPRVSLTVLLDIDTLAGMADRPGEITGYGTVTASTARALASSAATVRALVEHQSAPPPATGPDSDAGAHFVPPGRSLGHSDNASRSRVCGTLIDPGRLVYRPPQSTADYVRIRDQHCQFPGCRTRAERCDIDHRVPYHEGGATCPCNLDVLCRAHHRLKTFTSWHAEPKTAGRLVWTSPLGNTYAQAPEPRTYGPRSSETAAVTTPGTTPVAAPCVASGAAPLRRALGRTDDAPPF